MIARHLVTALIRKIPLQAEVALVPGGGVSGDHRNEKRALLDFAPDLLVPDVAAAQLALIEPDFEPGGTQRLGDSTCSLRILGCVAQEYCARHIGHGFCDPH